MINKIHFCKAAAVLAILSLSLTGCSKDAVKTVIEDQIIDDTVMLSQTDVKSIIDTDDFSASFNTLISDFILNNGTSGKSSATNCFSAETTETGYTITFDNCSLDGRTENLTGTIEMKNTSTPDLIRFEVTWTNFGIDDYEINGKRTYILKDFVSGGQYAFQIYSAMKIKNADAIEVTEEGNKRVDFLFDNSTETFSHSLTGDWIISSPDAYYTVSVGNALKTENTCAYITEGIMNVSTENGNYYVDFGDGTCDDKATLGEIQGESMTISLKD